MKKEFFYNKQKIDNSDINLVAKSLKAKKITKGKYLSLFEERLAHFMGAKYCLATSNATSAFDIVISFLHFKKMDLAIVVANTFCAAANSLNKFNKKFIFCDINEKDPNINCLKLEEEILFQKKRGKKIKLVIVTDYSGYPADWKDLKILQKKYNFILINDNCHALGSTYYNDTKYACKFADIVIQSFHAVKNITTAEGGAILTNNKNFHRNFRNLREHGFVKKNKYWEYDIIKPGFNARLSEMQSALGCSQLNKINLFLKKRRLIANYYDNYFKKFEFIETPVQNLNKLSSYHLYYLRVNFKKIKITKEKFFKKLISYNIFPQIHYVPTYKFKIYKHLYSKKKFKNNEKFYKEVFSLPLYVELKRKDIIFICKKVIDSLCKKSI